MKLTEALLRKPPTKPREVLGDASGLRARHGVRGWSFYFRGPGPEYREQHLGRFPELGLRDARMAMAEKLVESMWKAALLLALTVGCASAPVPAQAPVPAVKVLVYCCTQGLITDRAFGVGSVTVEEGGCSPCQPNGPRPDAGPGPN